MNTDGPRIDDLNARRSRLAAPCQKEKKKDRIRGTSAFNPRSSAIVLLLVAEIVLLLFAERILMPRMRNSASFLLALMAVASGCSRDKPRTPRGGTHAAEPPSAQGGVSVGSQPPLARGTFVGNRYESLPKGVTLVAGAVLPASRAAGEYELARVKTPRGEMIWFDSLAHSSRATPARTVRAELKVPPLSSDERLFMASCDVGGKLDPRVVAIVVNEPNVTTFTKIRQAWRVNSGRGQFELIPVAGITCEEPGG
jgi:hypothetical protein